MSEKRVYRNQEKTTEDIYKEIKDDIEKQLEKQLTEINIEERMNKPIEEKEAEFTEHFHHKFTEQLDLLLYLLTQDNNSEEKIR